MRQIVKNEPNYFTSAKAKVPLPKIKGAWSDKNIEKIRPQLREHILLEEQNLHSFIANVYPKLKEL